MMRFACWLYAASSGINRVARVIAGGCFFGMLTVVMIQVVARYVFASPPFWTEELARWLMVWGGLLGASVAFHTRADPAMVHPNPDDLLRQKIQLICRFVAAWVFFVPVAFFSWPFLLRQLDRPSEGLEISTAWMASALPVACVIICLHALAGLATLVSPALFERELAAVRRATEAHME